GRAEHLREPLQHRHGHPSSPARVRRRAWAHVTEQRTREPAAVGPAKLRRRSRARMLAATPHPGQRSGNGPTPGRPAVVDKERRVSTIWQPALATLSHERFWAEGWIYERKLDGQRCLAVREGGAARLYSRSGNDAGTAFPEVVDALAGAGPDLVVD